MKSVRFKVWSKKRQAWVSPNVHLDYSGLLFWSFGGREDEMLENDEYEVCLSTGLKDKNGKEIFEGDVCRDGEGKNLVIKWDDHHVGFVAGDRYMEWLRGYGHVSDFHCDQGEVIGNIYENPELLEAFKP